VNNIPNPNDLHPIVMRSGERWLHTIFLKNVINHSNIRIGDYSYYNDFNSQNISDFREKLFPYMHEFAPEKVEIGKFVQIAHGVQIITNSANHQFDGFSSYPFNVFGEAWASQYQPNYFNKGDNIIGHDVWIGHEAIIMPGVKIGSGAIIGSRSVVAKDIPDYAIAAGNPAKIIKMRFDDETIEQLIKIAWWDWDIEKITNNIQHIVGGDISKLISHHD
jgi:virginiamycin A acetyltransferase